MHRLALLPALLLAGLAQAARPTQDSSIALVQLQGEPLSTYVKTKPAQGKKIDFAGAQVKAYRAQLSALRNDFKQWLRSNLPQATVSGEFDISLNAVAVKLNGASLDALRSAPQVKLAQYQGIYYPVMTDPDLAVIKAEQAWSALGGAAGAGTGVKVAIVDSGIDTGHPCFGDAGYAAHQQLGDRRFTNNKVIAAKVFNMKSGSRGYTAEAIDSHGTHVAGTVACNYQTPTVVDGVALPYAMSGVAPRALLGNYNVFPADVGNARSEDILNALESAYQDGFDVANMSLGGGASGIQDLLTIAVDNLDQANMVVAVAAGNEGPGERTVGSPGSAARALTAGASSVGHQVVHQIQLGGAAYTGVKGDFGAGPVTAPLSVLLDPSSPFNGLSLACSPYSAGALAGRIALISRGACDFSVKLRHVQAAGGVGAVVVNREPGAFTMGQNGDGLAQPTIPGFMVDPADAAAFKAADGVSTTLPLLGVYQHQANQDDIVADFTSQGPTDVDFRIKPDVMAPGVNIVSSVPRRFCGGAPCFAFFNGTSMATPHLAGSAALMRQQHPGWSAAEIRSALVNTADHPVVKNLANTALLTDVNLIGSGRVNLVSAQAAKLALDPVSISFGAVPGGSGQHLSRSLNIRNVSGGALTLELALHEVGGSGVDYTLSAGSLTLAAGESTSIEIGMRAQKGLAAGNRQAALHIRSGGTLLARAMLYLRVQ